MTRAQFARLLVVLMGGAALAGVLFSRVPMCPLAATMGVPCPGCGLTRATLALVHGDVALALRLHPLVLLLAPLAFWAALSAALDYVRGVQLRQPSSNWLATRAGGFLATVVLVATLGVWGLRFLGYFGGPVPVQTIGAWLREIQAHSARPSIRTGV